jgi:hypothetical protein
VPAGAAYSLDLAFSKLATEPSFDYVRIRDSAVDSQYAST